MAALGKNPPVSEATALTVACRDFGLRDVSALRKINSYEDTNFWLEAVDPAASSADAAARAPSAATKAAVLDKAVAATVAAAIGVPAPAPRRATSPPPPPGAVAWVLKFHNAEDSEQRLECLRAQEAVLEAVAGSVATSRQRGPGRFVELPCGQRVYTRLLRYIPGELLFSVAPPRPLPLMRGFGATLGRADKALLEFRHPGSERELVWDIRHARGNVERLLDKLVLRGGVLSAAQETLLRCALAVMATELADADAHLRLSVVHGDANDHNVLVGADGRDGAIALIDWGDMVFTWLAADPAIAVAYVLIADGAGAAAGAACRAFMEGYCSEMPLLPVEQDAIYVLVVARLALSVSMSSTARAANPGNAAYVGVHAQGAWDALAFLMRLTPEQGRALFFHDA
jgi:Ser/Thr protein kinase RdoA (MazF antagonist)